MTGFAPRTEILPPAQAALWPAFAPVAGLGFTLYGPGYPPMESVRALCWFGDGDLDTPAQEDRKMLTDAAAGATGRAIPTVSLLR